MDKGERHLGLFLPSFHHLSQFHPHYFASSSCLQHGQDFGQALVPHLLEVTQQSSLKKHLYDGKGANEASKQVSGAGQWIFANCIFPPSCVRIYTGCGRCPVCPVASPHLSDCPRTYRLEWPEGSGCDNYTRQGKSRTSVGIQSKIETGLKWRCTAV